MQNAALRRFVRNAQTLCAAVWVNVSVFWVYLLNQSGTHITQKPQKLAIATCRADKDDATGGATQSKRVQDEPDWQTWGQVKYQLVITNRSTMAMVIADVAEAEDAADLVLNLCREIEPKT